MSTATYVTLKMVSQTKQAEYTPYFRQNGKTYTLFQTRNARKGYPLTIHPHGRPSAGHTSAHLCGIRVTTAWIRIFTASEENSNFWFIFHLAQHDLSLVSHARAWMRNFVGGGRWSDDSSSVSKRSRTNVYSWSKHYPWWWEMSVWFMNTSRCKQRCSRSCS